MGDVTLSGPSDVRTAPPAARCDTCNCSIAGGASERLLRQFADTHEGHE